MKKLVAFVVSCLSLSASAFTFTPKKNLGKPTQSIELDIGNVISIRGEFDDSMASKFIKDVEAVRGDEVFVYISSPGGSVVSGMKMVSYARSTPKKLICIVDVSISMAFVFLQACDERISTENSIAMQHVTSYGIRGQQAPNAVSFQKFLERMAEQMDKTQAKRVGLSYEAFKVKTRSDWWAFGQDLVTENITDANVPVVCTKRAILETEEEIVRGPFGTAVITWSKCPMLSEPVKVDMSKFYGSNLEVANFVNKLNVRQNIVETIEGPK